ncbi:hypothetical protein CISIN_1g046820mg [Citrus sinensis]|uniref:U-box domain-containing protein n=1 Tax=Citrus sinensis TaxID=2711 RepID=A0A067F0G5_CITSI|nr:hypothetical protein CISIN_1g046820mg [Citrus sinensis]
MIRSWRRLRASRHARKEQPARKETGASLIEKDPVTTTPRNGITYDRVNILIENERIIPVCSVEVLEINSKIKTACETQDQVGCKDLVAKIKEWAKESESNKSCIVDNAAVSVLAAAFESFSKTCLDENVSVLEEILSTLILLFPLEGEALTHLGSASSMGCMIWFLNSGDLSRRRNAVLLLTELVSSDSDQRKVNVLSENEGAIEALFKLIEEPISPTATKAALVVIYHTIASSASALSVLDGICSTDCGRENANDKPLTMPVVVKKILRVSELATELSVSILWKLCMNEKREEKTAFVEALQVGAFQKLLVLLQVGCAERTKEKASEVLKLMNLHRDRLECVDGWTKGL